VSHGQHRLAQRTVLVTGASRGIGAAVAIAAAEAGASVAIGYRERSAEAEEVVAQARDLGAEADAHRADISEPGAARGLVAWAMHRFGRIDALVNNAGVMPSSPFLTIDEAAWHQVLQTNLSSAYYCTQAALPGMLERGSGSVVMITSRLAHVGWPELAHYCAAKAGLVGLTRSLAREFGPMGVRINAVAPGPTNTDMTRAAAGSRAGRRDVSELPLGRFAEPHEVAEAVIFLLSDAAVLFHGQTLHPNGGGHMP
jgi:3-oxoacyl-[acyl-carrier protein] reductase